MKKKSPAQNKHLRVRSDHATELAEDYVEAIAEIIVKSGCCRGVDLVNRFAVSHVTVNRTIGRLERDGYVKTQPYKPIALTAKGRKLAEQSRTRHDIVLAFLLAIGVSESTAIVDSEGIEHHVSHETLDAMQRLVETGKPSRNP